MRKKTSCASVIISLSMRLSGWEDKWLYNVLN